MNWETLLLNTNAILCLLIAIRLMFFDKAGKTRRFGISVFAYMIILSSGYTAFRIIHGDYSQIDPGELTINMTVCIAVWLSGGNLAKLVRRRDADEH